MTPIGVDERTRHSTWLVYDPAAHNVAKLIGAPSPALRRQLADARCQPVGTDPGRPVYLVPRHPLAGTFHRPPLDAACPNTP